MTAQAAGKSKCAQQALEEAILVADRYDLNEELIHTYLAYGHAFRNSGQLDRAGDIYARAIDYCAKTKYQDTEVHMHLQAALGGLLCTKERYAEARVALEKAVELRVALHLPPDQPTLEAYTLLARCYGMLEDWENADVFARQAYDMSKDLFGASNANTLWTLSLWAMAAMGLGNWQRANTLLSRLRTALNKKKQHGYFQGLETLDQMVLYLETGMGHR
ncbi:MAG TPA: tetratricopeptide repeat protein [Candidatus Obscuribacterales bacterium]